MQNNLRHDFWTGVRFHAIVMRDDRIGAERKTAWILWVGALKDWPLADENVSVRNPRDANKITNVGLWI